MSGEGILAAPRWPGMSVEDRMLLGLLVEGLNEPFADPVSVGGVKLSRATARALERQMLRLRTGERQQSHPVPVARVVPGSFRPPSRPAAPALSQPVHAAENARG